MFVNVDSAENGAALLVDQNGQTTLTFDADNWNQPQQVNLYAPSDEDEISGAATIRVWIDDLANYGNPQYFFHFRC